MEALEYHSTPELLTELQRRFDDSVFVGAAKVTGTTEDFVISLMGSYHSVLGLTMIARMAAEAGDGTHGKDDPVD
tara:strand:- start:128 stop:352 length:225 start_codon:yes stop_codon:yes gene_type:complete